MNKNSLDSFAPYYLGNLLFDRQPEKAMDYWKQSRELNPNFGLVHRNLGWVYHRIENNVPLAIESYEKALACGQPKPRLFLELDQLYEIGNASPQRRYAALEKHHEIISQRVESFVREIEVLVLVGKYDEAITHLSNNYFHVREGDSKIHDIYVDAHLLRGIQYLEQGNQAKAIFHFEKASEYPENLSVGRPQNDPRAPQIHFLIGLAYEEMEHQEEANTNYKKAATQEGTDNWAVTRFYQAMAMKQLKQTEEAKQIFDDLLRIGQNRIGEEGQTDFFAKFGEQETQQTRKASGHYILSLAYIGLDNIPKAIEHSKIATEMNQSHVWAQFVHDFLVKNQ
jgi:tetratricopeptide (TPR) repeat protein